MPRALLLAALVSLGACTDISLNDAPIVDKSTAHGAPTPAATPAAGDASYSVQPGDTLYRIAQNFHCSVQDLVQWNGLTESTPLAVGQQLRVRAPLISAPAVPVQAMVSPPTAAQAPTTEPDASAVPIPIGDSVQTRTLDSAMAPASPLPAPAPPAAPLPAPAPAVPPPPLAPATVAVAPSVPSAAVAGPGAGWIWPVEGRVTTAFDPAHGKGIDIAVADGTPVLAVADGEVSYTGSPRDYGNLVILRHGTELLSVYAHNKSIGVTQGQQVKRGQTIATAGRTGDSAGVLHFEVRRKGVPVDPLDYLPVR